ncbi:MAG: class III extradiol ring-cleavage dioxygenase [Dongiaceae bacterium]
MTSAAIDRMPILFLSHGSPMLPFEEIEARDFLLGLGRRLRRPHAILCISAHWDNPVPSLTAGDRPETIHDFHGFPPELYQLHYPAPGAPDLADQAAALIRSAGFDVQLDSQRGLDHGVWNPLLLIYPAHDIPVAQLSILSRGSTADHVALGKAIAALRDQDVLILASGGAVHNLRAISWDGGPAPAWASNFDTWLHDHLLAGDVAKLVNYRRETPDGAMAHPGEDHILPLFVALGAASVTDAKATQLHRSFVHGSLSMAAYQWS